MNVQEFSNGMKRYFNLPNTQHYLCPTSFLLGKVSLDILLFDNWLHKKHGQYEDKGLSMKNLIKKEYGVKAVKFIQSIL